MKSLFKNSFFLITILFAFNLIFNACDKDNDNAENSSNPLLSSVSYYYNGQSEGTETYQYDKQGRLIKMTYDDGEYSLIEYSASTVTVKDYEDGELGYTVILNLNSKGQCVSQDEDGDLTAYEYDSNGYRKSSVYESDDYIYTETFTVSGGNYVTIVSEDQSITKSASIISPDLFRKSNLFKKLGMSSKPQNTLKSTANYSSKTDFQFYLDKSNTIDYENMGVSFLGKQNKNLIKEEKRTSTYESETYTDITTYTYEYDSIGRVTKQTDNDGSYSTYTYID